MTGTKVAPGSIPIVGVDVSEILVSILLDVDRVIGSELEGILVVLDVVDVSVLLVTGVVIADEVAADEVVADEIAADVVASGVVMASVVVVSVVVPSIVVSDEVDTGIVVA